MFFFCPACEAAWEQPEPTEISDLRSLEELAPTGLALPTLEEIHAAGLSDKVVAEIPYAECMWDLDELLGG